MPWQVHGYPQLSKKSQDRLPFHGRMMGIEIDPTAIQPVSLAKTMRDDSSNLILGRRVPRISDVSTAAVLLLHRPLENPKRLKPGLRDSSDVAISEDAYDQGVLREGTQARNESFLDNAVLFFVLIQSHQPINALMMMSVGSAALAVRYRCCSCFGVIRSIMVHQTPRLNRHSLHEGNEQQKQNWGRRRKVWN